MIIINPDNASNTIEVLPRYYNDLTTDITVVITNEDTREDLTHTITNVIINDGFLSFDTDANFRDNTTYRLKITDTIVVFRGKIFATTQSAQNYLIHG